jgi:hypothetical protein
LTIGVWGCIEGHEKEPPLIRGLSVRANEKPTAPVKVPLGAPPLSVATWTTPIYLHKRKAAMDIDEAQCWLRGERSLCNTIPQNPSESWESRIAEADAFMIQQAYWVAKADYERLICRLQENKGD